MAHQTLAVSALYLLFLIGPGYVFLSILGIKKNRFLLSYGISFAIVVLSLTVFQLLGGTLRSWLFALGGLQLLILFAGLLSKTRFIAHEEKLALRVRPQAGNPLRTDSSWPLVGFFFVVAIITFYHLVVGPYTEIPSDFWEHLARAESRSNSMREELGEQLFLASSRFIFQSDSVYRLHGLATLAFGSSALDASPGATLALSIIFLGSIYWFSLSLVNQTSLPELAKFFVGLLTVFFTVLAFGTATFSYSRYYAYFPTIFCLPIVFLCVRLLLDHQNDPTGSATKILIIPVFLLVLSIVHLQELLFALVLMLGLVFWRAAQSFLAAWQTPTPHISRHHALAALAGLAIPITIWLTLRYGKINPWGYTPHTVGLPAWIPIIGDLPVANPGFRFWDTLGFFGVLVYIIYLTNWKLFKNSGYVFVGMISPLLTHFNPFYAYLFLHLGESTALWRTSYLMPLSFVASVFLVDRFTSATKSRNVKKSVSLVALAAFLLATLLPFEINGYVNRLSRLPSLLPVEKAAGRLLWHDLIVEVTRLKKNQNIRDILTDHVTKFVLDSAVFGKTPTRESRYYFPDHNADYENDLLGSDFSHHLLIVNKRNGQPTGSSLYSGHWHPKILDTSGFYPAKVENFIQNNRDHFRLLWKQNSIAIYHVVSPMTKTLTD